jgi:FkbM family methyltransferase
MLVDTAKIFALHRFRPKGVIQVGAHMGQEVDSFVAMGIEDALFFEPLPMPYAELLKKIVKVKRPRAFQVALGPEDGTVTMSVEHHPANKGMSSSCLRPKLHTQMSPDVVFDSELVVPQRTLDGVLKEVEIEGAVFDFLCMDVQGYEGAVLRGAEQTIRGIQAIVTEINCAELYEGCVQVGELDEYLAARGFKRVETYMVHRWWGDACYMRM